VERPRCTWLLLLLVLVLAPFAATVQAQVPVIVRLSNTVGDTIDRTERDSFDLFPNTTGFQQAVFISWPGSGVLARVTTAHGETTQQVFYRVAPGDLQRIRFIINNREYVTSQQQSDSTSAQVLSSFWQAIEERPLASTEGTPTQMQALPKPHPRTVTGEHRLDYGLHGATCGSIVGGCIGAYTGYPLVQPGHYEVTECGRVYIPPVYGVDVPVLLATSIGATVAGAAVGYALGAVEDRKPMPPLAAVESTWNRNSLVAASVIPAIATGLLFGAVADATLFGREFSSHDLKNDPHGLSVIPAVLAGACISVDIVALCYQVGLSLDRSKAEQAEQRNRSPER